MFVVGDNPLVLDDFLDLLEPHFNEKGSNKYQVEVNLYKYFTDFLESCVYDGKW